MFIEREISLSTTFLNKAREYCRSLAISSPSLVMCLVLLLALLLRLQFFVGHGFADDMIYSSIAHRILEGNSVLSQSVFSARTLFLYAMAFFAFIFGYGEFSLTLFQLLCSLGEIILIYKLGSLFIDKKTGLIAALLLAFYPLNIIYSTRLMPDIPLAFFLGLNVYFFWKGEKENRKTLYLLSGVSLGCAYLIKGIGLLQLFPIGGFILVSSILNKRIKITHCIFILSLSALFLLEMIYFKMNTGQFLGRFQIFSETYTKTIYQGDRLSDIINYYPKLVTLLHHTHFKYLFGLFFYMGGIILLYCVCSFFWRKVGKKNSFDTSPLSDDASVKDEIALLHRKGNITMLVIWMLFWVLYLQLGSMSFSSYVIIEKHERFLTLFTIPFFILMAYFLSSYKNRFEKYFNGVCIAVVLLSSVYFTNICCKFHGAEIRDNREIKEYLEGKKYIRVYADGETNIKLDFLFNYEKRRNLIDLNNMRRITQIKGNSYLITHGKGFVGIKPSLRKQLSDEAALWKRGWKLEKVVSDNSLEGFKHNRPRIFYVP